jgi:hypothetical protein
MHDAKRKSPQHAHAGFPVSSLPIGMDFCGCIMQRNDKRVHIQNIIFRTKSA